MNATNGTLASSWKGTGMCALAGGMMFLLAVQNSFQHQSLKALQERVYTLEMKNRGRGPEIISSSRPEDENVRIRRKIDERSSSSLGDRALSEDLLARLTQLEEMLACVDSGSNSTELTFGGCNINIVNGQGQTESQNSLGNLIIGYNEANTNDDSFRSGSHNLVVGAYHKYSGNAGAVLGRDNSISGTAATVTGGAANKAEGYFSSVSGGTNNNANGVGSSVLGGSFNVASGNRESLSGTTLEDNLACVGSTSNAQELIFTGCNINIVNGLNDTETKNGFGNLVIGYNEASGDEAQQRDGSHNLVVGAHHTYTSKSGAVLGRRNRISGMGATVVGGSANFATETHATVSGGTDNVATGFGASVSGGRHQTASGDRESISGTELEDSLACVDTSSSNAGRLVLSGCNVHIENGLNDTRTLNGLGNLIVGYNEISSFLGSRSGSHNLIVGINNRYDGYGGVILGRDNYVFGNFASITGGSNNVVDGDQSSVAGGSHGAVSGNNAVIVGGRLHNAQGNFSTVVGGYMEEACDENGVVVGETSD